ncbi:MAG: GNAT family N-acetyltransferase [Rhodobacteraceae bacterium]|nr:GNAT family N-acetyltransferase [Paracoccaceae bacterium]
MIHNPSPLLIDATVLATDRLILRAPETRDFDAYAAFRASDRSTFIGGPLNRAAAWRAFATDLGHWLLHGYGMFSVIERDTAAQVGMAGFWNPEGWLEPELGWTLFDGFEGRGFAQEAALRLRAFAYGTLGWTTLTSVIAPGNARSIALAERLGARRERDWTSPAGSPALIFRHPSPEAIAA